VTIKARLTIAVVLLLAAITGLLGWIVIRTTRDAMTDQIDDRLLEARITRGPVSSPPVGEDQGDAPYRQTAAIYLDENGDVEGDDPAGFPDDPEPLPELPPVGSSEFDSMVEGDIRTLSSRGGPDYRATATPVLYPGNREGFRVVATSLEDVDETTSTLLRTVLVVGALVVLIGAGASWLIIRRGLRPVDRMIDTASAIAAGDLSQRVDERNDGTELGRLADALDEMLGQLEAAFKEREANEARLKQFVADAAHELRTPLAAIRGYAELYRSGGIKPGPDLERAMARVEGEGIRMGHLVDDLVLLARLDQHQPFVREPVDMAVLARDAVADLQATDPDRPVDLDVDGAAVVLGDEPRLRQVLANLLANARVHTPAGTPVHVSVQDGDGEVVLRVADEGPGVDPGNRARIFERFYRTDVSRSRDTGGSGLGLSIVAAVVAAHGGRADVDGEPGQGAVFTVRLPAAQEASTLEG
jgi:two-component system, OmpR family, sensor kinase